jgi:hypothetical protein
LNGTDFPRGWIFSNVQSVGATASVTVPATAGVVHVLDSIDAVVVSAAAAAVGVVLQVFVTSPAPTLLLGVLALNGGQVQRDEISLSSLDIATAAGGALTVTFNAASPANYNEFVLIQGHDV